MKVAGSLILSLMLAATVCAWKPAKDIVRTDNSQQFDYTAYTDSTSGSTHAVYCNVTDKNIHYIHVDSNGVAEAPVVLSTGQLCWNGADVIGIHDGNRIYAVYSGVRSKDDYVYDTYFVESKNGGKVWSKPVAIARADMKDYANRMWPKVLVNSQTKRVFVFYDYQGSLGENIIMMATRPPGSTIFVNERKVLEKAYLDISRPILTEEKSTSSLLQLYWRDVMTNTAYRSVSKSSGLYWEPAEKLVNSAICGPAGKDLRLFKVVGAQAISTNSLVAVCGKLGEHYYARISHNQGKDWEATMTEIPTRTIHEWDVCPNGNEAFLLVHIEGADGKPKIGKLWLSSGKYEEKAYPTEAETKLVARVGMGCISKDGRVRMMLEELEGQKWVQRAYDDSDNLSE